MYQKSNFTLTITQLYLYLTHAYMQTHKTELPILILRFALIVQTKHSCIIYRCVKMKMKMKMDEFSILNE